MQMRNLTQFTFSRKAEKQLGNKGRILLRPSGTEELIRVMVEAETQNTADSIAKQIAEVVKQTC